MRPKWKEYTNSVIIELKQMKSEKTFLSEVRALLKVKNTNSLEAIDAQAGREVAQIKSQDTLTHGDHILIKQLLVSYKVNSTK